MSHRSVILKDLDCISFDMDMTLVRYHNLEISDLVFNCIVEAIEPSFPELKQYAKLDIDFCKRGLLADIETGYFLKLDDEKRVIMAYDGDTPVSSDVIDSIYHSVPITDVTSPFHGFHGDHTQRFISMITFFEIPLASIIKGYALFLKSNPPKTGTKADAFKRLMGSIVKAYDQNFNDFENGEYHLRFRKNPSLYVYKAAEEFKKWLKYLRSQSIRVLLVTNSQPEYCQYLMTYSFGEDFRDYFDLIVTDAKKPEFFKDKNRQFCNLGTSYFPVRDNLDLNQLKCDSIKFDNTLCYKGGNVNTIIEKLKEEKKKDTINFCYVGDNLMCDIVAPKVYGNWLTVAIVEELEDPSEVVLLKETSSRATLTAEHGRSLNGKIEWGGYFIHRESTTTFWTKVIKNHADFVVPSVDVLCKNYDQLIRNESVHYASTHGLSPSTVIIE